MKLLFLTPQLPYPPHKGTTLRNFNLIRQLAHHEIHLVSFADDEIDVKWAEPLRACCARIDVRWLPHRDLRRRGFDSLTSRWPDMALRCWTPAMRDLVRETLARESFDVVQVEGIEMARYWLGLPPALRQRAGLAVFDEHNAEYVLQQRAFETDVRQPQKWLGALYSFIQWRKLVGYERRCLQAFDVVVAVSETDRQALLRLAPGLNAAVVPNGIDTDFNAARAAPDPGSQAPTLVFTGTMDFRPNVDAVTWFCADILPLVRAQVPDVHLTIVGVNPKEVVQRLGDDPAVTVTGWVTDVRPYIKAAAAYVIPLRMGGGTRFKVLEAMALGVPIVSTRVGCEGIDLVPGEEVLLADEPAAFARAVVTLLQDPARGLEMTRRARRRVEEHYDWRAIVPRLARLYETTGVPPS